MSGSGVVHSFLEVYLVGHRFHVYSDHQALQSVMSNRCPNKRGTCWSLFLQEFDFDVVYRPGRLNGNADGLSRQCWSPSGENARAQDGSIFNSGIHLPEEGGGMLCKPNIVCRVVRCRHHFRIANNSCMVLVIMPLYITQFISGFCSVVPLSCYYNLKY